MSADDITADGIRGELLGLGHIEIDANGSLVANRQRFGHVQPGTRVGKFVTRSPAYIEFLLRELEHRERVIAEKDRRIAELEADRTDEFAQEHERAVGDVQPEEH